MEALQQRPPGHALPRFSCNRGELLLLLLLQGTHLSFLPFFPFPAFSFSSFSPFPLSASLSSLLSFTFAFLDFAAPASADDVARLRALAGDRLRPLRVVVVLKRVLCMPNGIGLVGGDGSQWLWLVMVG